MSIPTKLLILVALFLFGIAIGWHLRGNEDAAAKLAAQRQEVKQANAQADKDAQSARAHESRREQTAARDRIVIERVAVAAADYHTCELKPDDLALLNQAIGGDDGKQ